MTVATLSPPEAPDYWCESSLLWHYLGDWRLGLAGSASLILQVAHPVVGAGVFDHSVYKTDPWGRMVRTSQSMMRLVYSGEAEARREGERLRHMHQRIRGTGFANRPYDARDPHAWAWVHATMAYLPIVRLCELFEQPLDDTHKARLYAECCQLAEVLGVDPTTLPADVAAFEQYLADMIENTLADNPVVEDIVYNTFGREPRPPLLHWLPLPLWRAMAWPLGKVARLFTLGGLPDSARQRLAIPWGRRDRLMHRTLCLGVRFASVFLRGRLRYHYFARQAMARRRQEEIASEQAK